MYKPRTTLRVQRHCLFPSPNLTCATKLRSSKLPNCCCGLVRSNGSAGLTNILQTHRHKQLQKRQRLTQATFLLALNKQDLWKGLLKPICRQSVQHLTPQDVTSFETSHRNFMFGQWKPRTSHLPRKLITHLLFHLTELLFQNMLQPSAKWSESNPLFWPELAIQRTLPRMAKKKTSQNCLPRQQFSSLPNENHIRSNSCS